MQTTLTPKLISLIQQTPDGAQAFLELVGNNHEAFFGNPLNHSKLKKYVAGLVGIDNVHQYMALSNTDNKEARAMDTMQRLLRGDNDSTSDTYYDFFVPVFTREQQLHSGEYGKSEIGVWTTVYFDSDAQRIEISQSFKGRHEDSDDLVDMFLHREGIMESPALGGLDVLLDTLCQITHVPDHIIARLRDEHAHHHGAASVMRKLERYQQSNDKLQSTSYLGICVLRAIQTLEMKRITDALGTQPVMDFASAPFPDTLFFGTIDYHALA